MKLLVDVGNSCIKWATYDSERIIEPVSIPYEKSQLNKYFEEYWTELPVPDQVLVSNVAGFQTTDVIKEWVSKSWKIIAEFVKVSHQDYGVINAYKDVSQLGIDRWLALIATWQKFGNAACIVDCGTAITIDGLSDTGYHLGGVILPGLSKMQKILTQQTSRIPKEINCNGEFGFADNTQQGVASGCTIAVILLIEHFVESMRNQYGENFICVITGGEAENLLKLPEFQYHFEPHLVLQGLVLFAEDN